MIPEDVVQGLQNATAELQDQISDLKQDKRDLRADKESLKIEVSSLKEELKIALGKAAKLAQELQQSKADAEQSKKEYERDRIEQEKRNSVLHQSVSVQTEGDFEPFRHSNVATSDENMSTVAPNGNPSAPQEDSAEPALELHSSNPLHVAVPTAQSTGADGKVRAPEPMTRATVNLPAGTTILPVRTSPRKRKAIVLADAIEVLGPRKRVPTVKIPVKHGRRYRSAAAVIDPANPPPNRGRPVISYKEDEAFVLPPRILTQYLEQVPTLDITPTPSDLHVTRAFLANIYGGSPMQSAQHVMPPDNPSDFSHRAFTFPKFELNPAMPLVPGQGGLIIASHYDRKTGHPWGLFRQDITRNSQTWVYLGEYEWRDGGKMSAEVFRGQKATIKDKWAKELLGMKRGFSEYYTSMRARIALRKAGLIPAKSKTAEQKLVLEELARISAKKGRPVNRMDIIDAFERGEEMVDITLLHCVSYDRTLALDIEAKFRNPPPTVKRKTKKVYFYPTNFKSVSALTHGVQPTKKRATKAKGSALASIPPESSTPSSPFTETTTVNSAEEESSSGSYEAAPGMVSNEVDIPQRGTSGVCRAMSGEEYSDDGLTASDSDDEMYDLSYP